jgi:hypothetical protein
MYPRRALIIGGGACFAVGTALMVGTAAALYHAAVQYSPFVLLPFGLVAVFGLLALASGVFNVPLLENIQKWDRLDWPAKGKTLAIVAPVLGGFLGLVILGVHVTTGH